MFYFGPIPFEFLKHILLKPLGLINVSLHRPIDPRPIKSQTPEYSQYSYPNLIQNSCPYLPKPITQNCQTLNSLIGPLPNPIL